MKLKVALYLFGLLVFGNVMTAANAAAQTVAYRQTNLASNIPGLANELTPELVNPWGIAFLSGQPFFIANNADGRVNPYDATGLGVSPGGFTLPNAAGTGLDHPNGIIADQNSSFGGRSLVQPFIMVTDEGTVFEWGPDPVGDLPSDATLVLDNTAAGAVYKGVAILNSPLTSPVLAVTNFHSGFIETFLPGFAPVATSGPFSDPNLPAGYAPFGIQVIGEQVFVTYAVQDAAKHDPVFGNGNGIVNIFDLDGTFVKRFATGGTLNAPWGVALASANFGPFSNDILIGNVSDGSINAFNPATGEFIDTIKDGDGNVILDLALHGLTFRPDGFGDRNTLYLTTGLAGGLNGVFAAITPGLVSVTGVSVPTTQSNLPAPITVTVRAGTGNTGTPTGTVTVTDGGVLFANIGLTNGQAVFPAILTTVGAHIIEAQYNGDADFLPSSARTQVQITGPATTLRLVAPANAAPGTPVTLTATINSPGGTPTGQIVFHDGNAGLGSAPLNATGVATLTVSTLSVGTHSLTADYAGDGTFAGSTSTTVNIAIANVDFTFGATPPTATVVAGQSTQFALTVTPAGGFTNNVTFSCAPVAGITCAFNPPTVTPTNGAAGTVLTVTTSASVSRYGVVIPRIIGTWALCMALGMFSLAMLRGMRVRAVRASILTATAAVVLLTLSFTLAGCGSSYGNGTQMNRGTATVSVTAQSGAISHAATVRVTVQ